MARTALKVGDLASVPTRTIREDDAVFDFSDPKWQAFGSARDPVDVAGGTGLPVTLYFERELTAYQTLYGNPGGGVFALPTFSGRGLEGASSGVVAVGAGQVVTVVLPSETVDTSVIRQALYMSKVGTSSPLYLVAEGPNGFAGGSGFPVGDPTYVPGVGEVVVGLAAGTPAADSVLTQETPAFDQSQTEGETANVVKPTITSATPGGSGGTIDAGNHEFVALNIRRSDGYIARVVEFEMILIDSETGRPVIRPTDGTEELAWTNRISA
jgi:hypothetical protein